MVLHIIAAVQLWLQNRAARPVGYYRKDDVPTSYAARTMIWSGPIVGAFVIFHVLHLTVGAVVPLRDIGPNRPTSATTSSADFRIPPSRASTFWR